MTQANGPCVLPRWACPPGLTHRKFPSPANDYIEERIDLNRELVSSRMSTEQLVVVGDATRGLVSSTVS